MAAKAPKARPWSGVRTALRAVARGERADAETGEVGHHFVVVAFGGDVALAAGKRLAQRHLERADEETDGDMAADAPVDEAANRPQLQRSFEVAESALHLNSWR